MHITPSHPFRCHYRHAVPGQAPIALFIQLRARDADAAQRLAESALGRLVDRVEPAPFPFSITNPAKEV
ncbi:hypothetical protein [Variovorax sp. EL159]|uniref:hypothetical protein n=1 Tax=Variovorax sp. EL159 TaxID=1566270 RepID=UPI000880EC37|nr:hypothetical protein [Variovorax sp. EL159]SCX52874.1 hypothetical protein SAMN03159363_1268 [Variovorax sp. EL159]